MTIGRTNPLNKIAPFVVAGLIGVLCAPPAIADPLPSTASQAVKTDELAVAFPTGYWMFTRIAEQLSAGGEAVSCEPALKCCVAFVSLKARDQKDTLALLGAALDVEFEPTKDDPRRFMMRRSRAVSRRESAWRDGLASRLKDRLAPILEQERQKRDSNEVMPTPAEDARAQKQIMEVNDAYIHSTDRDQRKIYAKKIAEIRSVLDTPHAAARLALLWLDRNTLPLDELVRVGYTVSATPAVSIDPALTEHLLLEDAGVTEDLRQKPTRTEPDDVVMHSMIRLNRDSGRIQCQVIFPFDTSHGRAIMGAPGHFGMSTAVYSYENAGGLLAALVAGKETDKPAPGFGRAALRWLRDARSETDRALAMPAARERPKPTAGGAAPEPGYLSAWVEAWSKASGGEVVMELFPASDPLEPGPGKSGTLADLMSQPSVREQWDVSERGGVFLITDRWAFWDRARPVPTAALMPLFRDGKPDGGSNMGPVLPRASWFAFVKDLEAIPTRPGDRVYKESFFNTRQVVYRGVPVAKLADGLLPFAAWYALDAIGQGKELADFLSKDHPADANRSARVPLSRLSRGDLETLNKLRATYGASEWLFEDQLGGVNLGECSLALEMVSSAPGKRTCYLNLEDKTGFRLRSGELSFPGK